jgi:hypothetical protein
MDASVYILSGEAVYSRPQRLDIHVFMAILKKWQMLNLIKVCLAKN